MNEGKPGPTSEPASYMGATPDQPDTNTNLSPDQPGGPVTPADRRATRAIENQHAEPEGLPAGVEDQSDPAKQMDNSGLLDPEGTGPGADVMGASGEDRNEDR